MQGNVLLFTMETRTNNVIQSNESHLCFFSNVRSMFELISAKSLGYSLRTTFVGAEFRCQAGSISNFLRKDDFFVHLFN